MRETAEQIVERGRAAWPQVPFEIEPVANRLSQSASEPAPAHAADFCLALACAEGVRAALTVFENEFLSEVDRFIARIDSRPDFCDEVKQQLRERLLLGERPRIAEFSGRGPLGAWLRIASIRLAIDLRRGAREIPDADVADEVIALSFDPELALMRAQHRSEMAEALRCSLSRLTAKQRNVLRMHFSSGWTLDRIGKCYRVHRATVMRWIDAAREQLLDDMSKELGDRLGLGLSEIRSLVGLLRSQIDVSLSGLDVQD